MCHTPIPCPTRKADPNRVRGARLYTGTLIDLFFLRAKLVPVGIQTISVITKIIYIYKRTTTGVVSIKIYTHILSPIYTCTFSIEYILQQRNTKYNHTPSLEFTYYTNTYTYTYLIQNIRDCGSSAVSTYL